MDSKQPAGLERTTAARTASTVKRLERPTAESCGTVTFDAAQTGVPRRCAKTQRFDHTLEARWASVPYEAATCVCRRAKSFCCVERSGADRRR